MNLNWLYGPRIALEESPATGIRGTQFRPVLLDMDDVTDVADYVPRVFDEAGIEGPVTVRYSVTNPALGGEGEAVERDSLSGLGSVDRGRLSVTFVSADGASGRVQLARGTVPSVEFNLLGDGRNLDKPTMQARIADKIVENGSPIIQWRHLAHLTVYLPLVCLIAATIWMQTDGAPTSLVVFGWLVVLFALVGSAAASARIRRHWLGHTTGCRIRNESRKETFARRADQHKDLKVAAITVALTLLAGVIAAWLIWVFGIKS